MYFLSFCLQEEVIDESLEFIIIASDGLWDTLSNQVTAVIAV